MMVSALFGSDRLQGSKDYKNCVRASSALGLKDLYCNGLPTEKAQMARLLRWSLLRVNKAIAPVVQVYHCYPGMQTLRSAVRSEAQPCTAKRGQCAAVLQQPPRAQTAAELLVSVSCSVPAHVCSHVKSAHSQSRPAVACLLSKRTQQSTCSRVGQGSSSGVRNQNAALGCHAHSTAQ